MHAALSRTDDETQVQCNSVYENAVIWCANDIGYGPVQRTDVSGWAQRVLYIGEANGGSIFDCRAVCDDPSIALADPSYDCNAWTLDTENPFNLYGIARTCVLMSLQDHRDCALYQWAPGGDNIPTSTVQLTPSHFPLCV